MQVLDRNVSEFVRRMSTAEPLQLYRTKDVSGRIKKMRGCVSIPKKDIRQLYRMRRIKDAEVVKGRRVL